MAQVPTKRTSATTPRVSDLTPPAVVGLVVLGFGIASMLAAIAAMFFIESSFSESASLEEAVLAVVTSWLALPIGVIATVVGLVVTQFSVKAGSRARRWLWVCWLVALVAGVAALLVYLDFRDWSREVGAFLVP